MIPLEEQSEEYLSGYLEGLQFVFDELTKMHQEKKRFDRSVIDEVWDRVRSADIRARGVRALRNDF